MKISLENTCFNIFAENIDCGYGSNEYPQSMFWIKIRKIAYPCMPQFYYIKAGFKEVYFSRTCFPDECHQGQS